MTKIIIKKEEEKETYRRIIKETTFLVNDKKVRVFTAEISDIEDINYDYPEVNEDDLEKLTDDEHEIFNNDIGEWLELKVGKKEIVEVK